MTALIDLEREYRIAVGDREFRAELTGLLQEYAGRPTPLSFARRLT